jgi:hypothetical protein
VARELGFRDNFLSRWRREAVSQGSDAFDGTGTPRDEELARLKRGLARVKKEREHAAYSSGQTSSPDPQPAAALVHGGTAKQGVGDGYHIHPNLAGLAVSGHGHGSLFTKNRRLGYQADDPPRIGSGSSYESRW